MDPVKLDGPFEEGGIENHATNCVNCIRQNNFEPNSPINKVAFATILAYLGNICYRTGTAVVYDPVKRNFINNHKADQYLVSKCRYLCGLDTRI